MNFFGKSKLRIQPLPEIAIARCAVCDRIARCAYNDRDLRAHVCMEDSAFVMIAELALLKTYGICTPKDDAMEEFA